MKQFIKEDSVLGLGSGTLAVSVMECLAAEREQGNFRVGLGYPNYITVSCVMHDNDSLV